MIKPYNLTLFQYRYHVLLLPIIFCIALWLMSTHAQAALSVTCTATMNPSIINLGHIIPENSGSASITVTLSYSCTNNGDTAGYVSVCLAANGGIHDKDDMKPRFMLSPSGDKKLAFNMWLSPNVIWGHRLEDGLEYSSDLFSIPAGPITVSRQVPISVSLVSTAENYKAPQGLHTSNFSGISTALTVHSSTKSFPVDCTDKNTLGNIRFPFSVQATFTSGCFISATSNINLESPSANANINGTGRIGITCHNDTSYNIGLSTLSGSSNGNIDGAGIMSGNIGNPEKIPYQLRSEVGLNGKPWGNNGSTYATLTNGVIGKGNGTEQLHTVYVTVPNTNVRPDTYSDVVTVTVYY